jgi:hypothetical protein
MIGGIYLYLTKHYLSAVSFSQVEGFGYWGVVNFLKGIHTFFFFFFVANSVVGLYAFSGYEMSVPIFNRPYLSVSIFDFWNRFLIQTKEFILKLFFLPMLNVVRRYVRSGSVSTLLTLAIILFFLDIPIHMLGVFDKQTIFLNKGVFVNWYLALIFMFSLHFFGKYFIPLRIKAYFQNGLGRVVLGAMWVSMVAIFY